jgi:hypothetical protein
MKLIELLAEGDNPRYDSSRDSYSRSNFKSTQKHTLTLAHINKLKKMRVIKGFEQEDRAELLGIMYGLPDEQEQQ